MELYATTVAVLIICVTVYPNCPKSQIGGNRKWQTAPRKNCWTWFAKPSGANTIRGAREKSYVYWIKRYTCSTTSAAFAQMHTAAFFTSIGAGERKIWGGVLGLSYPNPLRSLA